MQKESAVGEDGDGDRSVLFDALYEFPDEYIDSGFSRAGKGDDIDPLSQVDDFFYLAQNCVNVKIFFPSDCFLFGSAQLAIDAIQRTCFERQDVHTQGIAQTP